MPHGQTGRPKHPPPPPPPHTNPPPRPPPSAADRPMRPADSDLILPPVSALTIAASTRAAASASPNCSSIICAAPMAASGQTTPCPVYFGALPPLGSPPETPPGVRLSPGAGA